MLTNNIVSFEQLGPGLNWLSLIQLVLDTTCGKMDLPKLGYVK